MKIIIFLIECIFLILTLKNFSNVEKRMIEDDIAKDFAEGLKGINLLEKEAQKGVYLAYRYYISLFNKIKGLDAQDILNGRVRISNFKKILILIISQIELKLR